MSTKGDRREGSSDDGFLPHDGSLFPQFLENISRNDGVASQVQFFHSDVFALPFAMERFGKGSLSQ